MQSVYNYKVLLGHSNSRTFKDPMNPAQSNDKANKYLQMLYKKMHAYLRAQTDIGIYVLGLSLAHWSNSGQICSDVDYNLLCMSR